MSLIILSKWRAQSCSPIFWSFKQDNTQTSCLWVILSWNLSPFIVFWQPCALSLSLCWYQWPPVISGRLLANTKKRRGVACASLTCLKDLEGEAGSATKLELAKNACPRNSPIWIPSSGHTIMLLSTWSMTMKLLLVEQEVLDSHNDLLAGLSVWIKQAITASSPSLNESSHKDATDKLTHSL